MKKLLTMAFALAALAAFTGVSAGQGAQQKDKQKSPPTSGETKTAATAKNSGHASEQVMTGTVTKVNPGAKTFTVTANGKEANFSAKTLTAFPAVGETISITYTQNPGGPMEATTVKGSKSNGSERLATSSNNVMTGKVLSVDTVANTFTIMTKGNSKVIFSVKKGDKLPNVGENLDITYRTTPDQTAPGGPFNAINLNSSRSNVD